VGDAERREMSCVGCETSARAELSSFTKVLITHARRARRFSSHSAIPSPSIVALLDLADENVHAVIYLHVLEVLRFRLEVQEQPAEGDVHGGFGDSPLIGVLLLENLPVHDVLVRVRQTLLAALIERRILGGAV
jgi:hypothetical protein